jgi:hypothetical protein
VIHTFGNPKNSGKSWTNLATGTVGGLIVRGALCLTNAAPCQGRHTGVGSVPAVYRNIEH